MNRERLKTLVIYCLGIVVLFLAANRLWVGYGYDQTFRMGMRWAAIIGAEYVAFKTEHGDWPKPGELNPRLEYLDSKSFPSERVDRYKCGIYENYTLDVRVPLKEGDIQFDCNWRD